MGSESVPWKFAGVQNHNKYRRVTCGEHLGGSELLSTRKVTELLGTLTYGKGYMYYNMASEVKGTISCRTEPCGRKRNDPYPATVLNQN